MHNPNVAGTCNADTARAPNKIRGRMIASVIVNTTEITMTQVVHASEMTITIVANTPTEIANEAIEVQTTNAAVQSKEASQTIVAPAILKKADGRTDHRQITEAGHPNVVLSGKGVSKVIPIMAAPIVAIPIAAQVSAKKINSMTTLNEVGGPGSLRSMTAITAVVPEHTVITQNPVDPPSRIAGIGTGEAE